VEHGGAGLANSNSGSPVSYAELVEELVVMQLNLIQEELVELEVVELETLTGTSPPANGVVGTVNTGGGGGGGGSGHQDQVRMVLAVQE
jgi:hypothetical protein